jgi:hypothetical protein
MPVQVVVYGNFQMSGGTVDVEDDDFGRCTIVTSATGAPNALRRRAVKKLREMADKLESQITHKVSAEFI